MSQMSGLTVYHNPKCNSSRKAVSLLEERQRQEANKLYELEVCEYQSDPPSKEVLQKLADYLGLVKKDPSTRPWDVLLRPEVKNKAANWEETWAILEKDPAMLQRPFVIDWDNKRAALGRILPDHPDLLTVDELVKQHIQQ